jgi:anthranilate synthase
LIDELRPDILLISPGPGRPADFGVPDLVRYAAARALPTFGVCLGLQGMVEGFGGELGVLPYPVHGKPSLVSHHNGGVFEGLPNPLKVGRYHSLYAIAAKLPAELEVTSRSEDDIIMGIRHRTLPMEAVQFHPESLLSQGGDHGLMMVRNMVRILGR